MSIRTKEEKRAQRTERSLRQIATGHTRAVRFVTTEERVGLPPHEYDSAIRKVTRRFLNRVLEHQGEISTHKKDCRRCAMERDRAAAKQQQKAADSKAV